MPQPRSTKKEVKSIIDLVLKENSCPANGSVSISHEDLTPHLHDDDKSENRIQSLLAKKLKTHNIIATKTDNGYDFAYNPPKEEVSETPKKSSSVKTGDFGGTKLEHSYVTPMIYSDVHKSVLQGDTPLLVGPPGCGKSIMLEQIAADFANEFEGRGYYLEDGSINPDRYKFLRISLGGYLDPADLTGDTQLISDKKSGGIITKYIYGALTEAVEKGYFLICDEWDTMSPEANSVFQRITEADGQMIIKTEQGPLQIKKHPHHRMAFTANTFGHGDASGMFSGAQPQNAALKDRIEMTFPIDYNPKAEYKIIRNTYNLPDAVCNALYGKDGVDPNAIVNKIRQAIDDDEIRSYLTMRMMMEVAKKYRTYGWHKTMYYCFLQKFQPEFHETIKKTIKTILGSGFEPSNDPRFIKQNASKLKDKGFEPGEDCYIPEILRGRKGIS